MILLFFLQHSNVFIYCKGINQIRHLITHCKTVYLCLQRMSLSILSPRSGSASGLAIQYRMLGRIQARTGLITQSVGRAANLPFDRSSAKIELCWIDCVLLTLALLNLLKGKV